MTNFLKDYGFTISTSCMALGICMNEDRLMYKKFSILGLALFIAALMIFWIISTSIHNRIHIILASSLFCLGYVIETYTYLKDTFQIHSKIFLTLVSIYLAWSVTDHSTERNISVCLGLIFMLLSQFYYIPKQRIKGQHFSMSLPFFLSGWTIFLSYASFETS